MQDFEVARGQDLTITVTADGSPLPSCKWYHNDQPIQIDSTRVEIIDDGPTHTFKLLNAQMTDEGQYKVCSISLNKWLNMYSRNYYHIRRSLKIHWAQQSSRVKSQF